MDINGILASIDNEIFQLQQARSLLAGSMAPAASVDKRRGRPKGSRNNIAKTPVSVSVPKRTMSEEGKQRIAAAQRARWAAHKKSVKAASKKTSSTKKAAPQSTS